MHFRTVRRRPSESQYALQPRQAAWIPVPAARDGLRQEIPSQRSSRHVSRITFPHPSPVQHATPLPCLFAVPLIPLSNCQMDRSDPVALPGLGEPTPSHRLRWLCRPISTPPCQRCARVVRGASFHVFRMGTNSLPAPDITSYGGKTKLRYPLTHSSRGWSNGPSVVTVNRPLGDARAGFGPRQALFRQRKRPSHTTNLESGIPSVATSRAGQ
jgi:hypothetical protein